MKFWHFFTLLLPALLSAQNPSSCRLDLGPNPTVCTGASFLLNPNPIPGAQYNWSGPIGLSCTSCPTPLLTLNTPGSYTYFVTLTTNQCVLKDTLTVTVLNGQHPRYNIIDDMTLCKGLFVSLGGPAVGNNSYTWFTADGSFNAFTSNPVVGPTKTTTYYLSTGNSAVCPVNALDSVVITVSNPPTLLLQADTAICKGQTVALGRTVVEPNTTYKWTPGTGLNNAEIANPIATPQQKTTYTLAAINNGCEVTRAVTVDVLDVSLQLNVGDTIGLCAGKSVEIKATTGSGGGGLSWAPLTGLQLLAGGSTAIATPTQDVLYTVTAQILNCTVSKQVYVKVNALPSKLNILPADTTICQGSTIVLQTQALDPAAYPGLQYQWLSAPGQLTATNLPQMSVKPNGTTRYSRLTSFGGCMVTVETTVSVVPAPFIEASPTQSSVCAGQSVQLSVSYQPGIFNITWSPQDGLDCSSCENPIAKPSQSSIYIVTGQSDRCPATDTVYVDVSEKPSFIFPTKTEICIGDSVRLNTGTVYASTNYQWTSTAAGFGNVTDAQPLIKPTETATYYVLAQNNCGSDQGQVSIFVSDGKLTTSKDTTICKGASITLHAAGAFPGTYLWTTGQTDQTIVVKPNQSTFYTVQYTYPGGCSQTKMVTVFLSGENAALQFPTDRQLCAGENIELNSLSSTSAEYKWTSNPPGFSSMDAKPKLTPTTSTTYLVETKLGNCRIQDSLRVEVFTASLSLPPDITVCAGDLVSLTATGVASISATYEWSNGKTSSTINETPVRTTTYSVQYLFGDNCSLQEDITVNVRPGFDSVSITMDPDTNKIFSGESLALRAVVKPTQSLTNFTFEWLENGTTTIGTTESVLLERISADPPTRLFKVTVKAPNGCVRTDTVSVAVCPDIVRFPNAFTPGNDDLNERFGMHVIGGNAAVEKMTVYNRWGQLIFESVDPKAAWDGAVDGQAAPSDVYLFIIQYRLGDGTLKIEKGEVTLVR